MYRNWHRGLSQENTVLDLDACLKNQRGINKKFYLKNVQELTQEDYLKKIQYFTGMLVSRIKEELTRKVILRMYRN